MSARRAKASSSSTSSSTTSSPTLDVNLYPSVAVSDAFNAATSFYAASLAYAAGAPVAASGFASIAVAGSVGVARFGFAPKTFARANGVLADVAGRIGIPLLMLDVARTIERRASDDSALVVRASSFDVCVVAALCAALFAWSSRASVSDDVGKLVTTLLSGSASALLTYIAATLGARTALAGVVLFLFAGLVVTPDRHRRVAGVRREDWFHYVLGVAMVTLAYVF